MQKSHVCNAMSKRCSEWNKQSVMQTEVESRHPSFRLCWLNTNHYVSSHQQGFTPPLVSMLNAEGADRWRAGRRCAWDVSHHRPKDPKEAQICQWSYWETPTRSTDKQGRWESHQLQLCFAGWGAPPATEGLYYSAQALLQPAIPLPHTSLCFTAQDGVGLFLFFLPPEKIGFKVRTTISS